MFNSNNIRRRTVLKSIGGSAAAVALSGATVSTAAATIGDSSQQLIFCEPGAQVPLPSEVDTTSSLGEADTILARAGTELPRDALRRELNRETTLFFVGSGAKASMAWMLFDSPTSPKGSVPDSQLTPAADIDARFGVDIPVGNEKYLSALVPRGGKINTHLYGRDKPLTNDYLLSKISKTFALNRSTATTSDSYDCPDAEDGWKCIGRTHDEDAHDPYGQREYFVWGAKADSEDNDSLDYFAWEVQQTIVPGTEEYGSNWQNSEIRRMADFPDSQGQQMAKHGPDTQGGHSTTGVSVDVSVGLPKSVGGNLGFNWSETYNHTKITEDLDTSDESATHEYDFKKNKKVAKHSKSGYPGYRLDVDNNTDTVEYYYENVWWWIKDNGWRSDEHHSEKWSGESVWTA